MKNDALPQLDDLLSETPETAQETPDKTENTIDQTDTTLESITSSEMSLEDLLGNTKKESIQHTPSFTHKKTVTGEDKEHSITTKEHTEENLFNKAFQNDSLKESDILTDIEQEKDKEQDEEEKVHLETEEGARKEDPFVLIKRKEYEIFQTKERKMHKLFTSAQGFVLATILITLGSFLSFSLLMDTPEDGFLGSINDSSYGTDLKNNTEILQKLKTEDTTRKKEIKKLEKEIDDIKKNKILGSVTETRIDWITMLKNINKVRCDASPTDNSSICQKNYLNNKSEFNPFTFKNYNTKGEIIDGKMEISASGSVSAIKGRAFEKVSRLKKTFNDSKYFSGAQISKYSKTPDKRLGYTMPFTFKLTYHTDGKITESEDASDKTSNKTKDKK